uniref:Putative secreted protein n=1 Tax=Ixodes ricinus TaxID=34613 RepID=A0A6B0U101_IXORI
MPRFMLSLPFLCVEFLKAFRLTSWCACRRDKALTFSWSRNCLIAPLISSLQLIRVERSVAFLLASCCPRRRKMAFVII